LNDLHLIHDQEKEAARLAHQAATAIIWDRLAEAQVAYGQSMAEAQNIYTEAVNASHDKLKRGMDERWQAFQGGTLEQRQEPEPEPEPESRSEPAQPRMPSIHDAPLDHEISPLSRAMRIVGPLDVPVETPF
jgi:hypothetical protein